MEDVKRYVARLRHGAEDGIVAIGHGELGESDRVLLSIAERAGAVELAPGGPEGLLVKLTGRGSPRKAYVAIKAAKDRGWESYRSIERFSAGAEKCRRRQILDHGKMNKSGYGGIKQVIEMMKAMDEPSRTKLLEKLAQQDPKLVQEIRKGLF